MYLIFDTVFILFTMKCWKCHHEICVIWLSSKMWLYVWCQAYLLLLKMGQHHLQWLV